eukprot:CAMPEP_0172873076 /NCGR_PEP_ID=MMETSP1075-20121228/94036_1 /TAXON_ID=2916 /ORGANISM="Ceratium fusus, Strain PA161109" /LENGTH=169 /DNA_ID=CAMNT_0013723533 /DNA_START=66 /DNA_END=571 /DNA_ORIENTATION=+
MGVLVAGYAGQRFLQSSTAATVATQEEAGIVEQSESHCSAKYKDCRTSKCCKDPGLQCFQKNEKWATCMSYCEGGLNPVDKDPVKWNCSALGPRTSGPIPAPDMWTQPASWVQKKCAATGKDCAKQGCCKDKGKQCYKKNDKWHGCKEECVPGPDPIDNNNDTWDCTVV